MARHKDGCVYNAGWEQGDKLFCIYMTMWFHAHLFYIVGCVYYTPTSGCRWNGNGNSLCILHRVKFRWVLAIERSIKSKWCLKRAVAIGEHTLNPNPKRAHQALSSLGRYLVYIMKIFDRFENAKTRPPCICQRHPTFPFGPSMFQLDIDINQTISYIFISVFW